jgi:hypothetical protein
MKRVSGKAWEVECNANLHELIAVTNESSYNPNMSIELQVLEDAARAYELEVEDDFVEVARLASVIDRLQAKLSRGAAAAGKRGEHLLTGDSPTGWVAKQCQLSRNAAADRLCVGEQLPRLPQVAEALSEGRIGYQAASVLCHLEARLTEAGGAIEEEEWLTRAREWPLKWLSAEAAKTWHAVDPAGFELEVEEAHERRQLFISECGDMYRIDGWLEVSAGEIVKTAIDSLSAPLGSDDTRRPKQRRADALTELAQHKAHPQVAVHTTIEGLKGELGAPASELGNGSPISSQTVQRLACDGVLHRVLKADSMVVDVGRAKRTAQPAQLRALQARHKTCAWPGCDRPASWTQAHHIDLWKEGGRTDLRRMIPLCYHHHRLVHEGGWQVVKVAERLEFIAPDRPVMVRRRWGEKRWAA